MLALLLASVVACAPSAPDPAALAAQWPEAPAEVVATVAATEDPVVQLGLALAVAEAHPGQTAAVCEALPDGDGKTRCSALNNRSHLNADAPAAFTQPARLDPTRFDPSHTRLEPITAAQAPSAHLARTAAVPVTCTAGETEQTCRLRHAREAAERGEPAAAVAGLCAGIETERWQAECRFAAAEKGFAARGASWAQHAVDLCLANTSFRTQCITHLAMRTGRHDDWAFVVPAAQATSAALATWDGDLAQRWRDRVWAEAADSSLRDAPHVTGDLLDLLPAEAAPQVRAAAAWRLWQLEGTEDQTLDAWSARLDTALARRTGAAPARFGRPPRNRTLHNLWTQAAPGDTEVPRTTWFGVAWRGVAQDASADGVICLLEAAVRQGGGDALVAEATAHPDPVVRWTAERLRRAR